MKLEQVEKCQIGQFFSGKLMYPEEEKTPGGKKGVQDWSLNKFNPLNLDCSMENR